MVESGHGLILDILPASVNGNWQKLQSRKQSSFVRFAVRTRVTVKVDVRLECDIRVCIFCREIPTNLSEQPAVSVFTVWSPLPVFTL